MKKNKAKLCRMLLALAALVFMFSGVKTNSRAANDTIVIDFSKLNPQTYNGKKLTSADLDKITTFNFNQEQKNVIFLSAMIELYKVFPVDNIKTEGTNISGRVVVNAAANQYLSYKSTANSQQFDRGASTGSYEFTINNEFLKSKGNKECLMPYFAGKIMYGVDAKDDKGNWYFKVKIIFSSDDSGKAKDDESGKGNPDESGKAKEEETQKPKEEETTKDKKEDPAKVEVVNPDTDFEENGYFYKVTANGEVTFMGIKNKTLKSVNIPDTVVHQNITYSVTAIADKALYNNKKITKVTIGKNVKSIGSQAFAKCKKLKKVTIKSTCITSIGKKAFKKNSANLVVKVPKSKYNVYKKLLKKAGMPSKKLSKAK